MKLLHCLCLGCMLLHAKAYSGGTMFVSLDNDVFASSDDDYTNGIQVGWVTDYLADYTEAPAPDFLGEFLNSVSVFDKQSHQRFLSYSVSHRIFTPSDTQTTELVENDLPYSGMLFGTITAGAQDAKTMDAFSLHLGIVGPSAQGDFVQNEFHRIIGSDQVNGWDNQLRDEFLYNLNYEHRRRLNNYKLGEEVNGDILFQVGGALGNLVSMVTVGVGGRIGWNVPDDYYIPPQFFGEETIGSRPYSKSSSADGFWFFYLINASRFGNAIFWDGNSSKPSPSVDYDRNIERLYLGAVMKRKNYAITFAIAKTTVPWENPNDKSIQTYGRIGVTFSL